MAVARPGSTAPRPRTAPPRSARRRRGGGTSCIGRWGMAGRNVARRSVGRRGRCMRCDGRPLRVTRERTTVTAMQRLRPVTFWLRALWLGLALMLPLHAMATGLGWCPMSAVARAVFAIDAHTAHVVHADPHAHCAEQAPSGLAGDPSTAVVPLDAGRRGAGRAAEQPRPAGRLCRAGHRRGRAGAGRPAAQPGLQLRPQRAGDEREIERGLHLNLARLLAMPLVREVEQRRFEQVQARWRCRC
jgi:hypothetical protein